MTYCERWPITHTQYKCLTTGCRKFRPRGQKYCEDHRHLAILDEINKLSDIKEPKEEKHFGCWIYFVEAKGTKLIKIGRTASLKERMCALNTSSPVELNTIALLKATPSLETDLHEYFDFCRKRGEWFEICTDLQEVIDLAKKNKLPEIKEKIRQKIDKAQ